MFSADFTSRGFMAASALFLMAAVAWAEAEKKQPEAPPQHAEQNSPFKPGPTKLALGTNAEIQVPKGYEYLGAAETKAWSRSRGNSTDGKELGLVSPVDGNWIVLFRFNNDGFVKDDEKDSIDADAILESYKTGTEKANAERQKNNIPPMHVTGWKIPPTYNEQTKNLEWCLAAESEGEPILNYNTRILGRHGVMEAVLVSDPASFDKDFTDYKKLISGFQYTAGNTYGDFREGDKVAQYGLAALVAGGGLAAAAKTGLLGKLGALIAKMGKAVILVVIAALAGVKALFSKLLGRKKTA